MTQNLAQMISEFLIAIPIISKSSTSLSFFFAINEENLIFGKEKKKVKIYQL